MADWAGFLGATMLWVKAAHIIFVIFLMAGLFMMPRFFVYHHQVAVGSDEDKAWIERRIRILHHSFAANDTTFPFDVQDVGKICRFVIPALAEDNLLQKVRSPVSICGAVHGDYTKLRNAVTFGKRNERVRRAPRRING